MTKALAWRALPAFLFILAVSTPSLAGLPKVPDDFQIRLVANVPAVLYPCQVGTAPDGSLFVAEDSMDQVGPYESSHGKILQFKDGKDPVVYAEGFRAIFGMAWHDNALYVSHMPYLTVLRDTDGDGKVDSRKDLFKDLGITNNAGLNDHIVSGIQFGIDGKMYISVGDKGCLKATGPDGKTAQIIGGGTLRCRADGTDIEVVSTGTRNHLEANLDDKDNLFTYDNTDDGLGWWTRVTHHIDGGYYGYPYDYHDHLDRMLDRIAEYGGGSPCGGVVYKEDAWPEKYRNRVIWSEWGKRKVSGFKFKPKGASFEVDDVVELAEVGDSGEFRPIDVALSYDGKTLYLADWGMGSWGSKTEKVGRVYAITYKGPAIETRPRGNDSDPIDAQFAQLDHPSFNERMRAQDALIKLGKSALPKAAAMLTDPRVDRVAKRHLVWVVDGLAQDPNGNPSLFEALKSPVADVRAQAARALGERRVKPGSSNLAATLIYDRDPSVRLQAIIALGRIGEASSVPTLLPFLTDPDRYVAFSARVALRRIGDWPSLANALKSDDARLRAAVLATMELVYDPGAVDALKSFATDARAVESERARALAELAIVFKQVPPWDGKWWGTRPYAGKPPSKTVVWSSTPEIYKTIETSLADASLPVRLAAIAAVKETNDREALPTLRARFLPLVEADVNARREIALALGAMNDKEALPLLVLALRDPNNPEPIRNASLSGVESIGGPEATRALIELLKSADPSFKLDSQVRVIAALGRFKARDAVPTILGRLSDPSTPVRVASIEALGKIGVAKGVVEMVRGTLSDASVEVRKASLATLASLKDRESIPSMLAIANDEATRYEATLALAALPDIRALQVYLTGLTDRSQDVRKASSLAINAIRDKAEPALERLASRHELSPGTLPELRKLFGDVLAVKEWHVMGPFAANERPPVPTGKPVDLTHSAEGPDGKPLEWKPIKAEGESGMINLEKAYPGAADCSAFGYAEFESATARPAQVAVGSDDTLTVWVNGKQVYKFDGNRSYEPEVARFDVDLKKGKNLLMIKCGNGGGPWAYSVAITGANDYGFLKGPSTGGFNPDQYKAAALKGQGKADHGQALFNDLKGLACIKCHVVGGQGGAVGPELSGIAAKYPRDELVTSVLYPSQRISSGYEPIIVATADGRILTGLIRSDTADGLEIEDADARKIKIPKADIEDRKASDVSIMPNGIVEGISANDFADLIAYLETLKDASANQGKPAGK